ncbi:asparagine synthase (glutamine-hydrolyzing) [Stutzerimonas kunmingensis]|uniref:asparagine synthase (glutamine-hydrolyzing) n=1 Tax=Stutzerimonas kunmingensis TaxID=1211807 RepID=UPI00289FDAF2|nr:asparagine synthase (glutamine-hydrolyzing) [Stutzerimonas kunmingensis]
MCGIAGGYWEKNDSRLKGRLENALREILHRGPDDIGAEFFPTQTGVVALGHSRLSIIDLTPGGHQPMHSPDGRYAVVFNGEIYNYRELRTELQAKGVKFYSDSDTEVLLHAWMIWGSNCLERLQGMFAFVLLDRLLDTLICVRDAFGIKPFFYSDQIDGFFFASELSALKELMPNKSKIDLQRSYDYLVNSDYDSQPRTFIEGVHHLPPAHWVTFDLKLGTLSEPTRWWFPKINQDCELNFEQAVEAVREQFLQNIRLHLRSDVPLGAALSGGLDSSAVVCAMRYVEPNAQINTFSYIASGSLSEERWVDKINNYIGAVPHKVYSSSSFFFEDLTDVINSQGEPFGSTSIYAQYLVFKEARANGIKVTLDGQGADELLAGYNGYPQFRMLSMMERKEFKDLARFVSEWAQWPGRSKRQAWMAFADLVLPKELHKLARRVSGKRASPDWLDVQWLENEGVELDLYRHNLSGVGRGRRVIERLGHSLTARGLPGLLRHADRNSMRFSVESRVPFLTTQLADQLLAMPEDYLVSNSGETKRVFRAAMRGIVPDAVLDRRDKIGFDTNEKDMLLSIAPRIREYMQHVEDIPFMRANNILRYFDEFVAGKRLYDTQIWRWLNYCIWYRSNS